MTEIFYNGINPFDGLSPTPVIERETEMLNYGDRWGQAEAFNLRGQITGQCITFEQIIDKQNALLERFSQDYQTFEVKDNGTTIFSRPAVRVTAINFEQSNYGFTIPYTISLQAYPEDYFEGEYGILDPREEFNFQQESNGTLTITHTISARGFNTSSGASNALENARQWVQARQGLSGIVLPKFITVNALETCLTTQHEVVNRLAGTYEIRETYTSDLLLGGYGLLRYTTTYSLSREDGIATVRVQGDIEGCKNAGIEQARTRYAGFDAYQEAVTQYRKITGRSDLNPNPVSKGVSEDQKTVRIGFEFVFNDDLAPQTYFEYKVSFDYDYDADLVSASIEGTVKSRVPIATRWAAVSALAASINLYSILLPLYNAYAASIGIDYALNPVPRATSRTENRSVFEIELSARYDNAPIAPSGLDTWESSVDITPPLRQYSDTPCLNGQGRYYTADLGFATRGKAAIQAQAVGNQGSSAEASLAAVKTQILAMLAEYVQGTRISLDEQTITETNASFGLAVSASASYTYEGQEFTI